MEQIEKLNELKRLQNEIENANRLIKQIELKFESVYGRSVFKEIILKSKIIDFTNNILIEDDEDYIKIRVHDMDITKLKRCDFYEELKYHVSKIIHMLGLVNFN